jgi:hypothetical protein
LYSTLLSKGRQRSGQERKKATISREEIAVNRIESFLLILKTKRMRRASAAAGIEDPGKRGSRRWKKRKEKKKRRRIEG